MSKVTDEILAANNLYTVNFGDKANLASPPARKCAILTCMDARIDPAKMAGLVEGDAHVIRNAGGRASDDAIRSLVVSYKLLGTTEWLVIHHTACGMAYITDEEMAGLLQQSLSPATHDQHGWHNTGTTPGSAAGEFIDWLTIKVEPQSIVADVERLRNHPLVPGNIAIYGYIYDVKTGRLNEVPEATEAGRPR